MARTSCYAVHRITRVCGDHDYAESAAFRQWIAAKTSEWHFAQACLCVHECDSSGGGAPGFVNRRYQLFVLQHAVRVFHRRPRLFSCRHCCRGCSRFKAAREQPIFQKAAQACCAWRAALACSGGTHKRAALAILSIRNVEVWSVEVLGVVIAGTTGIAATARGLRQAALDHGFRRTEESLDEPLYDLAESRRPRRRAERTWPLIFTPASS